MVEEIKLSRRAVYLKNKYNIPRIEIQIFNKSL